MHNWAYINNVALYKVFTVLYIHSIKDCKCDKYIKNQYIHNNSNFMSLVQHLLCVQVAMRKLGGTSSREDVTCWDRLLDFRMLCPN